MNFEAQNAAGISTLVMSAANSFSAHRGAPLADFQGGRLARKEM